MGDGKSILMLLLKKNFLIRKKHWFLTFILPFLLIGIILLGMITWDTWHHKVSKQEARFKEEAMVMEFRSEKSAIRYTSQFEITRDHDDMIGKISECLNINKSYIKFCRDEDEMIDELKNNTDNGIAIGIVFQSSLNNSSSDIFKYKLKYGSRSKPSDDLYRLDDRETRPLTIPRWLAIQTCVDRAYIDWTTKSKTSRLTWSMQEMPDPELHRITWSDTLFISLIYVFMVLCLVETRFPDSEKSRGVNILMSVNGVKNHMNLFSWLVTAAMNSLLLTLIISLFLMNPKILGIEPIFQRMYFFILWLSLFVQSIHFISFGYHLSAYCSKPFVGMFIKFFVLMFMIALGNSKSFLVQHVQLYVGILSPNFLLVKILKEIATYESIGDEFGWSKLFEACDFYSPTEGSIVILIIFSILGIFFNFLMTVYVNAIFPGEHGVPRHPLFILQWMKKSEGYMTLLTSEESDVMGRGFETVPEGTYEPGLQIRGLKKTYVRDILSKTEVYALRGVSADFYKGQITALLGHNGAGKTTMISIWSGLTDASKGMTFINGKNIQLEPEAISNNVGLCPQKNFLFPNLTVYQHLMFFGGLKSKAKTTAQLEDDVKILLSQINMTRKKNSLPEELSGGQKRRLCIAIAVIGDANVLIFDEPTSGIDAESKRQIWNIILRMRGQKTIIISTHDMEEANILGDRIAIMHTGKLRSYGTSMFLKKMYGEGQIEVTLSVEPSCTSANILRKMNIAANVLNEDQGKIVLALPLVESLPEVLDNLENSKKMLGITGLSVSTITMDQIFMKVTEDESESITFNNDNRTTYFKETTGFSYFMQTFWAYFLKKRAFMMRNPWKNLISIFFPCLILPTIMLSNYEPMLTPFSSEFEYSLGAYPPSIAYVQSGNTSTGDMFIETLENYGVEIRKSKNVLQDLVNLGRKNLKAYQKQVIISGEFEKEGTDISVRLFYSRTATRAYPIAINCLSNALLKDLNNNAKLGIQISTETFDHFAEEERTKLSANKSYEFQLRMPIFIVLFLTIAVTIYCYQIHGETISGIKQLQHMTGASKVAYWVSMISFDIIQYFFSIILFFLALILKETLSERNQIYEDNHLGALFALFMLFGVSVLPFIYVVSSLKFSKLVTFLILTILPFFLSVFSGVISVLILKVLPRLKSYWGDGTVVNAIFIIDICANYLIPHVALTNGLISSHIVLEHNSKGRDSPNFLPISYFQDHEILKGFPPTKYMIVLIGLFVLYSCIILIIELRIFARIFAAFRNDNANVCTEDIDMSVGMEELIDQNEIDKRINDTVEHDNENIFLAYDLKKNYGLFRVVEVVKGISFRVKQGECFGLLGVNGAGKSTTFRMLTGAEIPSGGTMYTKNFGIHNNRRKYLAEMGYCPQHHVLIDTLDTRDHLYLFARLRGVPETEIKSAVEMWIQKLNLSVCAAQPSSTYSEGNKRRLQIAMALIGDPSLILMDEPTAGVDPGAKKSLWKIIKSCQATGQSVIFTSHSMEECEVLCNRLAIMIKGELVCLGAAQELKQRFGTGFNINIELSPTESAREIQQIKNRIASSLVCEKMDENPSFLRFHVTDPKTTWTHMYATMDSLKSHYSSIENYSVLSSTFEQLFIQFARAAKETENETTF